MLLLLKSKKQINKPPTFQKKVQKDYTISAPLFLSTPFCENRYQNLAAFIVPSVASAVWNANADCNV